MKEITLVIIFTYLILQSISDAKTKQVYTVPNNIILIASVVIYIGECVALKTLPAIAIPIVLALIVLCVHLGKYGSGDGKAMISIFLSTRYIGNTYPHPFTEVFFLTIFVSESLFLVSHLIRKKKEKKYAYFPFLTVGYAIAILLETFAH